MPATSVRPELFTHRFGALAGEMGEMLRRTALSTNVKERLDFSCALLDAEGWLVVNAPHIMEGGEPGARGRQRLVRSSGEEVELEGCDQAEVEPGDRLILETPGGGGWGPAEE